MTALGPFAVTASADEVAAFRAATGLPPGDAVPATFPMRWLAAPEVHDAILALADDPDLVPIHESQSFNYARPVVAGIRYALTLRGHRQAAPARLVIATTIADADGTPVVEGETILRLFSIAAAAA